MKTPTGFEAELEIFKSNFGFITGFKSLPITFNWGLVYYYDGPYLAAEAVNIAFKVIGDRGLDLSAERQRANVVSKDRMIIKYKPI